MLLSSKHICLFLHVGYTLAWLGVTRFKSTTTYAGEKYRALIVWVEGQQTTVEFKNTQTLNIDNYLWNRGRMSLSTDDSAVTNLGHEVRYKIHAFYNEELFVVRHAKKSLRLLFTIDGVWRPLLMQSGSSTSENSGIMVFSSNAERQLSREFVIQLYDIFINLGSISVLGTQDQDAQLSVLENKKDAVFANNGLIYIKHAEFEQAANFRGEGCIVIGHRGKFRTKTSLALLHQRFHFLDGSGLFILLASDIPRDNRYYITSFPKGAAVQAAEAIGSWKVEGSDFIFFNELRTMRIKITFERYSLEQSKVFINGNQMTYAENLVRLAPDSRCIQMGLVMAEASKYEIEA